MLPAPLILWIMKPLIFADKGLFTFMGVEKKQDLVSQRRYTGGVRDVEEPHFFAKHG